MLQSDIRKAFSFNTKEKYRLVISRFNILTPLAIAVLFLTQMVTAQEPATQKPVEKKADETATQEKPAEKKTEKPAANVISSKEAAKNAMKYNAQAS